MSEMLSETFWIFVAASGTALIGLVLRYSYESKCTKVKYFCLELQRDIQTELTEDTNRLNHNVVDNPLPSLHDVHI